MELVRDDFVNSGKFVVLERSQMDKILKEQEFDQTGCTDSSCAVEIGKLLSTKKILIGKVTSSASKIKLNIRIIDIETGTVEFSARDKASTHDLVEQAVSRLTRKLIARIEGRNVDDSQYKETRVVELTGSEKNFNGFKAMSVSVLPGLGQILYGDDFALYEGLFCMLGSITLGYLTYSSFQDMKDEKDKYKDLPEGLDQSAYSNKWSKVEDAKDKYKIIGIVTIGFYMLNFIDAFFAGRRQDTKIVISENFAPKTDGFFANITPFANMNNENRLKFGYRLNF